MKITAAELKELLLEETAYAGECGHIVDGIHGLVKDMDPHDVSEIFQTVFAQLPGVQLIQPGEEAPEGEEEEPLPTPYQPGGETGDRPVIGFREQLMEMVRQELRDHRGMRESKYTREKLLQMIRDPEWEGTRPSDEELAGMTDQQLDALMHAGIPEGP